MTAATLLAPAASLAMPAKAFFDAAKARLAAGARPLAFWGRPADDPAALTLTLVLEEEGRLAALRSDISRSHGFHSLTRAHPALHVFEREIFEQHGIVPHDHPWLKPVRFPKAGAKAGAMSGAMFETFVVSEIMKSWHNAGKKPPIFFYRDKDKNEIDLILEMDGQLHPVEIKKSANPGKDAIAGFRFLEESGKPVEPGGVVCCASEYLPLDGKNAIVPWWMI